MYQILNTYRFNYDKMFMSVGSTWRQQDPQ